MFSHFDNNGKAIFSWDFHFFLSLNSAKFEYVLVFLSTENNKKKTLQAVELIQWGLWQEKRPPNYSIW